MGSFASSLACSIVLRTRVPNSFGFYLWSTIRDWTSHSKILKKKKTISTSKKGVFRNLLSLMLLVSTMTAGRWQLPFTEYSPSVNYRSEHCIQILSLRLYNCKKLGGIINSLLLLPNEETKSKYIAQGSHDSSVVDVGCNQGILSPWSILGLPAT